MIFIQPDHIQANGVPNVHTFSHQNRIDDLNIPFSVQDSHAISLPQVPYAGIYSQKEIYDAQGLLNALMTSLKKEHVKHLSLKQCPEVIHPNHEKIRELLLSNGASFIQEINHHVLLDQWESRFSRMQLRRVRKCQALGLNYSAESFENLHEVYDFLTKCRTQQSLKVNIELNKLTTLTEKLSKNFLIRTVKNDKKHFLACLIAIKVTNDVIYSYLPAFDRTHSANSPLSFLFYEFFNEMKRSGFQIIDLGISSINGLPQSSLIRYKEGIGGLMTYRETFEMKVF